MSIGGITREAGPCESKMRARADTGQADTSQGSHTTVIYNKGRQASGGLAGWQSPRITGKLCFARATHRGREEELRPSPFLMNP